VDRLKGKFRFVPARPAFKNFFWVDGAGGPTDLSGVGQYQFFPCDLAKCENRYRLEPAEYWTQRRSSRAAGRDIGLEQAMTLLRQKLSYPRESNQVFDTKGVCRDWRKQNPRPPRKMRQIGALGVGTVKTLIHGCASNTLPLCARELARTVSDPAEMTKKIRASVPR